MGEIGVPVTVMIIFEPISPQNTPQIYDRCIRGKMYWTGGSGNAYMETRSSNNLYSDFGDAVLRLCHR